MGLYSAQDPLLHWLKTVIPNVDKCIFTSAISGPVEIILQNYHKHEASFQRALLSKKLYSSIMV